MLIIVSLNENQQLTCDIKFLDDKVLFGISYCYIHAMFKREILGQEKKREKSWSFYRPSSIDSYHVHHFKPKILVLQYLEI